MTAPEQSTNTSSATGTVPWKGAGPLSQSSVGAPAAPLPTARNRVCRVEAGDCVPGTGGFVEETYRLLRDRLRITTTIVACAVSLFLLQSLWTRGEETTPLRLAVHTAVAVLFVGLAVMLSRKLSPTRLCLRSIELITFGIGAAFIGWTQYHDIGRWGWPSALRGNVELLMLGFGSSIAWFSIIVLHGVFIPGPPSRNLLVTAGLSLAAIGTIAASTARSPEPVALETLLKLLFLVAIWLGFAGAIAAFCAYRMGALSREAFEARRLDRYILIRRLGEGGMGEVHLAEHRFLRRECAIKLIRPEVASKPVQLARFEREVQTTARLTHPNTVEIFDYGRTDDGRFYYVMEYLPGLSAGRVVFEHGPLAPERVVHMLRQVCGALTEAHAVGLIHRDIKPGNIMLCERGLRRDVAKVLDFGLVRTPEGETDSELTLEGTYVGTPAYMSPEQARGDAKVDGRCDLYSLGATAYCLLTGDPPFIRPNSMQTLLAQIGEPPVPPRTVRPAIPADVEAVVLKCLAKNPDERYADAAELERALSACGCALLWTPERAEEWWRMVESGESSGEQAQTEVSAAVLQTVPVGGK